MDTNYFLQTDLDSVLASIPNLPPVFKENTEINLASDSNKSSRGAKYIRTKLYPVRTLPATMGKGGYDRVRGLYEVTLFTAANTGVDEINTWADLIENKFVIGRIDSPSDLVINIEAHSRGVGRENTNMYILPVTIDYMAHVQRLIN